MAVRDKRAPFAGPGRDDADCNEHGDQCPANCLGGNCRDALFINADGYGAYREHEDASGEAVRAYVGGYAVLRPDHSPCVNADGVHRARVDENVPSSRARAHGYAPQ